MPEGDSNGQPSAEEQLRALYDNAESTATRAFEQAVSTPSFGALLARHFLLAIAAAVTTGVGVVALAVTASWLVSASSVHRHGHGGHARHGHGGLRGHGERRAAVSQVATSRGMAAGRGPGFLLLRDRHS